MIGCIQSMCGCYSDSDSIFRRTHLGYYAEKVLFDTYFIKTKNDSEYNFISDVKLYSILVNVIITYKYILQRFQMNNMVIRA